MKEGKFKKKELELLLPYTVRAAYEGMEYEPQKAQYLAQVEKKDIQLSQEKEQIIIIYLYRYNREIPKYTVFLFKNAYISYNGEKWLTSMFDRLFYGHIIINKEDEEVIRNFTGNKTSTTAHSLVMYQYNIYRRNKLGYKMMDIIDKLKNLDDLHMKDIWLENAFKWSEKYIFFEKRKKVGYCTCCHQDVDIPENTQFEMDGICPCCNTHIVYKSAKKHSHKEQVEWLYVIDKLEKDVLVSRGFCIIKNYNKDYRNPSFYFYEQERASIDGEGKVCEIYEREGYWQEKKPASGGMFYSNRYYPQYGYIVKERLEEQLKGTSYQYSGLEYVDIPMYPNSYLKALKRFPQIESLSKMGMFNIVRELVSNTRESIQWTYKIANNFLCSDARNIKEFFNIENSLLKEAIQRRELFSFMVFLNGYTNWYIEKRKENPKIKLASYEMLKEASNLITYYGRFSDISFLLNITSLGKGLKYFKKQVDQGYLHTSTCCSDWKDYLEMSKKVRQQIIENQENKGKSNVLVPKFPIFPKNFKKAHDDMVVLLKIQADEKRQKQFEIVKSKWSKCNFNDNKEGLMIVHPESLDDFVNESNVLGHCVKQYFKSVAEEETHVFFIRKEDEPDKPYYTMEVKDNRIKQIQGIKRIPATKEVEKLTKKWLKNTYAKVAAENGTH